MDSQTYSHYSWKYVPFNQYLLMSQAPSISYIEGYQYKARTLRVGYTIGLFLSAFQAID